MAEGYINCQSCSDKGWIETVSIGSDKVADYTLVIERCDACCRFLNDFTAANYAKKFGILSFSSIEGAYFKIIQTLN